MTTEAGLRLHHPGNNLELALVSLCLSPYSPRKEGVNLREKEERPLALLGAPLLIGALAFQSIRFILKGCPFQGREAEPAGVGGWSDAGESCRPAGTASFNESNKHPINQQPLPHVHTHMYMCTHACTHTFPTGFKHTYS